MRIYKQYLLLNRPLIIIFILLSFVNQAEAQRLNSRQVKKLLDRSEIMKEHFVGFILFDEEKEKIIYETNSTKYFLPASNTKLLTLYTALQMLGDSIPAFRYIERGDSLVLWGTGDPTFLHKEFNSDHVVDFLKEHPKKIYLSIDGDGTSLLEPSNWRADVTSFPIAGNVAEINVSKNGRLETLPKPIAKKIKQDTTFISDRFIIKRAKVGEDLHYPLLPIPADFSSTVIYPLNADITVDLLKDTLKRDVKLIKMALPSDAKTFYSVRTDSLLKKMMLPSDNFLAEQILLLCASTLDSTLNIRTAIDYSLANLLNDLPQEVKWADGSGLSRFNLFTPSSMILVIGMIKDKLGDENLLKDLLPVGGISGTLKTAYKTDDGVPFVWAKTGSLTFAHLQSGIITTRRGKKLRYSFMNNNYIRPTAEIREEMVNIMTAIHDRY